VAGRAVHVISAATGRGMAEVLRALRAEILAARPRPTGAEAPWQP
jgi:hypothetical protein